MKRVLNWRIILIIAITLGALVYLYPTFRYFNFVSKDRPTSGEELEQWKEQAEQMRENAIPLGLDIQGGLDVVLEIDVEESVRQALVEYQRYITNALDADNINADVNVVEDGTALRIEVRDSEQWRRAANSIDQQYGDVLRDWDPGTLTDTGAITAGLRNDVVERSKERTMASALKVIRERVNGFGLTQASVTQQGDQSVRVQIPGERDPRRVIDTIIRPAVLKFYLVHENNDQLVQQLFENGGLVVQDDDPDTPMQLTAPLLPGAELPVGYKALPGEAPGHAEPGEASPPRVMYIVREQEEMGGEHLDNAGVFFDPSDFQSPVKVSLTFDRQGRVDFHDVTRQYVGRQLAISLDEFIYSAPMLEEEISGGSAVIRGDFTQEEAQDLSLVLKAGELPPLREGQSRLVEATLGADSIAASLKALLMGAVIVGIFMFIYYGTAGFISVLALCMNILILMSIMRMANATLTLSGIGGILLTVGMAVDANVLIYERMREELRAGKPMRQALSSGFNRAFSVILDSNLTTLLTALVLLQFGSGSVQGFALTMTFGLLANLYTGLAVTYALCEAWFNMRGKLNLGKLAVLTNPSVKFINMRYGSFTFSAILIVLSFVALLPHGPRFAVDFTGGVLAEVDFAETHTAGEIDMALGEQGLVGTVTQMFADEAAEVDALVRVPVTEDQDLTQRQAELREALAGAFGEDGFEIRGSSSMTPEVGQRFSHLAWVVIFSASIAILAYLWFRFELVFGVAAVIAMVHDLFLTLGMITLLGMDISLDVVAAFLILLGYSVNDTIVIFDRIREEATEHMHGKDLLRLFNDSMNQCLSRTAITSVTTMFVMAVMFFFGGVSLRPFALTLVFGIAFGTYSSVFVAAPIVYEWSIRRRGGRLALTKKAAQQPSGRPSRRGGTQRQTV